MKAPKNNKKPTTRDTIARNPAALPKSAPIRNTKNNGIGRPKANQTNTIEIPNAGVLMIKCLEGGDGCILVKRNEKLEWVCNLSSQTLQTYYLQPGNYVSTWRAKTLKGSIYTVEKNLSKIMLNNLKILKNLKIKLSLIYHLLKS